MPAPDVTETRPLVRVWMLQVGHGICVIGMMHWIGVQTLHRCCRWEEQHMLLSRHLHTGVIYIPAMCLCYKLNLLLQFDINMGVVEHFSGAKEYLDDKLILLTVSRWQHESSCSECTLTAENVSHAKHALPALQKPLHHFSHHLLKFAFVHVCMLRCLNIYCRATIKGMACCRP